MSGILLELKELSAPAEQTEEIISGFDPAVICYCEFGEVSASLSKAHVDALQEATREAWANFGVAAGDVAFLYTPGCPYMTAFAKTAQDAHSTTY